MAIETLNLNSNGGMVDISKKDNPPAPMPEPDFTKNTNTNYDTQRENLEKNNIDKEQMMELSTPLNEVMDQQVMAPHPAAPAQQMQLQLPAQQMTLDPSMGMGQQQAPQQPKKESKNPGGLTDEQMDALLAGLVAGVAFSPQFKEMLARYVPSLFDETGARTVGGMAATALVAAALFLLVKRFILKR